MEDYRTVPVEWIPEMNARAQHQSLNRMPPAIIEQIIPEMKELGPYRLEPFMLDDYSYEPSDDYPPWVREDHLLAIIPSYDGVFWKEYYFYKDGKQQSTITQSEYKLMTLEDFQSFRRDYSYIDWTKFEPLVLEQQASVWDKLKNSLCGPDISGQSKTHFQESKTEGFVNIWSIRRDGFEYSRESKLFMGKDGTLIEERIPAKLDGSPLIYMIRIVPRAEVSALIEKYEKVANDDDGSYILWDEA